MTHLTDSPLLAPTPTLPGLSRYRQKQLLTVFAVVATALLLYELYIPNTESILLNFTAILITISALTPVYLWCAGKAQGLPIFPLFAMTFIWTYALPLLDKIPYVEKYSVDRRFIAGSTTTVFIGLSTLIWFQFVKSAPQPPKFYRALGNQQGTKFFLAALAASTLFNIANAGGWLSLSPGLFSILRNTIVALTALSTFVLAYRMGNHELSKSQVGLFTGLLGCFMITSAVSFLLFGTATAFLISTAAYIIGRKKIPFLIIIVMFAWLSLLHAGKAEMRGKYWFNPDQPPYIQVWEYPALYTEWIDTSLKHFDPSQNVPKSEQGQSFSQRSSVIQMLMLTQEKSPHPIPFLRGATYKILPQLLIPRILNPTKLRSHEGTFILSVHYKLQRYQDTATTTIGWGLLAESYANFGFWGCGGLAVLLGVAYGWATRWSINAPILSVQSLFAVFMLTFAIQTEWSAGVYVAALAQYSTVLLGIAVALMRNYRASLPASPSYELWDPF